MATVPLVANIFVPLMTHSSPSLTAVVTAPVMTLVAEAPVAAVFEMIAADASLAGIVLKLADTFALIDHLDSGRPPDRCV